MSNTPFEISHRASQLRRPRVVIGHPYMGRGGSEARVMWLIEALKSEFDVTVATTGGWDLAGLNFFYGTKVGQNEVTVRIAPIPFLVKSLSAAALRGACYQRFAFQIAGEYDVRVSAYNMTDWGMPAVHFIADFSWNQELRERFDPPTLGFFYRNTIARREYLRIAASYGMPSGRNVYQDDILIANSQWTAALVKQQCGVDCAAVVYPSVWTEFPDIPWELKEHSFVMIGRIAAEKQIERAISILDVVRQRGHAIRLHLCGQIENDAYGLRIRELCRERADWIIPKGRVGGANKARILSLSRFGIQTRSAEPFGIAVAEMIKAGAIVFAPNDGGQTEILDHVDLLFADEVNAAEKICAVLSNPEKQSTLRAHLAQRSEMFSAQGFMEAAQLHVKDALVRLNAAQRPGSRRKVVIGHPYMGRGGSESIMMWLIEALKSEFDVTVATTGGWDLEALNAFYGTNVGPDDIEIRIAPVPLLATSLGAAALRGACYQRFARQIAREYDVRISAYNMTDWGLPAVHFIADFSWNQELRERFDPPSPGLIYQKSPLRWAYLKIASSFGLPSGRSVFCDDILIANSRWTEALVKQQCGVDCAAVIYPSVWTEFPSVPWEQKEQSFVMIGRIAPEKQIERAIAILEAVRKHGHAIRLHLCGEIENDSYGLRIRQLCRERSQWIIPEGRVTGANKARILAQCRFGIQTRAAEPFGISVAEMIKAGAIVFAPEDGGQAEILAHPDLLFSDTNEAVAKILAVLEEPSLQYELRNHLRPRAQQFSAQSFMRRVQTLLADEMVTDRAPGCEVASQTS